MSRPAQPRPYLVRVYAPNGEIFRDRTYMAILDLTPGPGARLAKAELDTLLYNLAVQDNPDADVTRYRLAFTDSHTGNTFDWPAR